jgi:hypothetical protein
MDIEDCENSISRMRQNIDAQSSIDRSQDREIAALRSENDDLKLYLAALIRLLTSKGVVSTDEITRLVEAIDGEDGAVDGKVDGPVV